MTTLQKMVRLTDILNKILPEWVECKRVEVLNDNMLFWFEDDSAKDILEKAFTLRESEALRVGRDGTMFVMLSLDRC